MLGTATVDYRDHGRELRATSGSGEIHYARFSGDIHGITEEEGIRKD